MTLPRTASQTVGPYYTLGLCRRPENELADPSRADALELAGQLFDGGGRADRRRPDRDLGRSRPAAGGAAARMPRVASPSS